jgi:P4 family phage/plasmid primase-like protien
LEDEQILVKCDNCGSRYTVSDIGSKCIYCQCTSLIQDLNPDPISPKPQNAPAMFQHLVEARDFKFEPVAMQTAITARFNLITVGGVERGTLYKFNEKTKIYENAEDWLQLILKRGLGREARNNRIKEVVNLVKIETAVEEFPSPDPLLIPFKNCVYDASTGQHRDYTKNDYFFSHLAVEYQPEAISPLIDSFMSTLVENDLERQQMIDFASLVLVREIITAKMLLLVGAGSNGKSVFADLIRGVLGQDLYTGISLHALHDFGIEPLYQKRPYLNVSGELSSKGDLDQDIIKMLVSGEHLTINRKNKEMVTFVPKTKFMAMTNELPENMKDLSDGWCRRILPIYLERQFVEDEGYRRRLLNNALLSAWSSSVLVWNLKSVLERQGIIEPPSVDSVRSFFNENLNSVSAFCESCLEYSDGARITHELVQAAYQAFCHESKMRRASNIALGKGIRKYFRMKMKVRWNDPSPVDSVTSRSGGGQETFTQSYSNLQLVKS